MDLKLIFKLSLFGLAMSFATIYLISTRTEPFYWLIIFIICSIIVAKKSNGRYFLTGFLISLVNCIWITSVHYLLYDDYINRHPEMLDTPVPGGMQLRTFMLVTGPVIGIISGIVLGLFCWIASKIVKK